MKVGGGDWLERQVHFLRTSPPFALFATFFSQFFVFFYVLILDPHLVFRIIEIDYILGIFLFGHQFLNKKIKLINLCFLMLVVYSLLRQWWLIECIMQCLRVQLLRLGEPDNRVVFEDIQENVNFRIKTADFVWVT